jgi:Ca2+-binding RTX toxin-like protein
LVIGIDVDNAIVAGGPADDTIVAGLGTDQQLTGGDGHDDFVFRGPDNTVTITDFTLGSDTIDFGNTGHRPEFSDLIIASSADGSAVVQLNGNVSSLSGVHPDVLSASDVLFDRHQSNWPGSFAACGNMNATGDQVHGAESWRDQQF